MPPKRRSTFDSSRERKKIRNKNTLARVNETPEQTISRQVTDAQGHAFSRGNETEEQSIYRRMADAQAHTSLRALETSEHRAQRLQTKQNLRTLRSSEESLRTQAAANECLIDESVIPEHYCGLMEVQCEFCNSKNFQGERPSDGKFNCCSKGKVQLEPLREYPERFKKLLTGDNAESKNFLDNIRSFNSALGFVSMGASVSAPPGNGPYCFRIHGQIYHKSRPLHPSEGEQRKYAQLYILDAQQATEQRMTITGNSKCSRTLMEELGQFLITNNEYAKAHKMLYEVEKEQMLDHGNAEFPNIMMAIRQDSTSDLRRYNNPIASNEVAVVFRNEDGDPPLERDLMIYLRPNACNANTRRMSALSFDHVGLDPMTYPLLFPYGGQGWSTNIPLHGSGNRQRVSHMQYFSHRLSVRDEFNPLLNAGKLTQQYIVDSYIKTEANRLNWVRLNQKKLRADNYKGLMDYVQQSANDQGLVPGKMVILPSTFQGSPRNMAQNYKDAMAIVQKYGRPDLFVTMTCNPKWTEIVENLESWQKVEHRPDLVSRVFKLKLKELKDDIVKRHIFGDVIASIHVIEFQKRGLPHAHMLIILKAEHKLRTRELIDRHVRAEIPDRESNPRLHEIVLKHMIHGPCGTFNTNSPCMVDGKCSKDFPKSIQNETLGNVNGYPLYQRREGNTYEVRGNPVNNLWVVPYNPFLSLKFNCHINVEVCASIKSVKYLFKYVYKGHDCANIQIGANGTLNHNEIDSFVDSRYVSAPEAMWRLNGFHMHEQSHSIMRLAVHLPDEQNICFDENQSDEVIIDRAERNMSTLMGYFELNGRDLGAHEFLYHEIPQQYIWNKSKTEPSKSWKPRKRGGEKVIGRMYTVNMNDREKYFLRLLLLHVKGATSFEELRTVDGTLYVDFQGACKSLGLLETDDAWKETIQDAALVSMPYQLRQMFAVILSFNDVNSPPDLWEEFKASFIEDYCNLAKHKPEECTGLCEDYALRDVADTLRLHGNTLSKFNLKNPQENLPDDPLELQDQLDYKTMGEQITQSLNEEQKYAFDAIMAAVNSNTRNSKCFFLDGPGGSGKTYLYKSLIYSIKGEGGSVVPCASTGIAANLLDGGRTYHSQYKLPVPIDEVSVSRIKLNSLDAVAIKNAKLLLWDECTMAPKYALKAVDMLLKEIMRNDLPFGGKVMLLGGDFRQCLPVVRHGMRTSVLESTIKRSALWKHFRFLKLKNNVRSEDPEYSNWLLELGDGTLKNDAGIEGDVIEIPKEYLASESLVKDIYGEKINKAQIPHLAKTAILCPKNEDVDHINEEVLTILEGENKNYLSVDQVVSDDPQEVDNFPIEFLHSLTPSGMAPHKLNLKEGAIIMLLRNLNTKRGLCNGTRLVVEKLQPNLIRAKVLTGSAEGNSVFIPRIDITPSEGDLPFVMKRRQFPVKLAFAMTINKSQGQTLDKVGIFLPEPVFSHGQLYVAFSRVRRGTDVKVKINGGNFQGKLSSDKTKVYTTNVVYKEIFSDNQ